MRNFHHHHQQHPFFFFFFFYVKIDENILHGTYSRMIGTGVNPNLF